MEEGSPPCSPQIPILMVGRVLRPFSTAILSNCPTPSRSSTANGSCFRIPSSRYFGRNLLMSSREKPNVVCVRSLVPKLKNSASLAISSATNAARGNSIMVPTRYSTLYSFSANTSSATRRTMAAWLAISFNPPVNGIMTSGFTFRSDHGSHQVLDLVLLLGKYLFRDPAHDGSLVGHLVQSAGQWNHDLRFHLHALLGDLDGRLEDGARLHFRDLGIGDAKAAAAMAEHGIDFMQLLHPVQQGA